MKEPISHSSAFWESSDGMSNVITRKLKWDSKIRFNRSISCQAEGFTSFSHDRRRTRGCTSRLSEVEVPGGPVDGVFSTFLWSAAGPPDSRVVCFSDMLRMSDAIWTLKLQTYLLARKLGVFNSVQSSNTASE